MTRSFVVAGWENVSLPPPEQGRYFHRAVPVRYLRGQDTEGVLYVLVSSTYSTLRSGTWVNQTAHRI